MASAWKWMRYRSDLSVTRYALKPAEGVKLSRITALSNDFRLSSRHIRYASRRLYPERSLSASRYRILQRPLSALPRFSVPKNSSGLKSPCSSLSENRSRELLISPTWPKRRICSWPVTTRIGQISHDTRCHHFPALPQFARGSEVHHDRPKTRRIDAL